MNTEPKQSAETAMRNPDPSQVKPASDLPAWPVNYPPGDEIDLVDLGVLLWRRWRLMLAVFLVIVVLAILLAVFKRPSYEYTSGISLGYTVASSGVAVPMVSSQTAVNALQNVYVPFASAQYLQQSQASVNLPKFTVTAGSAGTDSSTVLLSCRGAGKQAQACIGIEKLALQDFVRDNSRATERLRATLRSQLEDAKLNLASLQSPAVFGVQKLAAEKAIADAKITLARLQNPAVFGAQKLAAEKAIADAKNALANLKTGAQVLAVSKSKLQVSADLLTRQIADLQAHVAAARKAAIASAQDAGSPTQAMSNLVLSAEVQQNVNLLNQQEQQLNVTLPQQLAGVDRDMTENSRAQALQNQVIEQNEIALQKLLFTHGQDIQTQNRVIEQNQIALQKLLFSHGQDIQGQEIGITNLQAQLDNIQDNRVLGDPIRSVKPVGLGRGAIVGLGIVIGIVLAIFAALLANYVGQVRERLRFDKASGK